MDEVVPGALEDKAALRSRLRRGRRRRDGAELARAATGLRHAGLARCAGARLVAAYASIGAEPPTRLLLDGLVGAGTAVLLPVITATGLAWARYDGWPALAERGGLLEPTGTPTGAAALRECDLVLAPALGVDWHGNRIGRGAGYYDRALVGIPRERIVAVVFTDEVVDVVPVEEHDVPAGAALTPDGLIELMRPASAES